MTLIVKMENRTGRTLVREKDHLLILGTAPCVWEDFRRYERLFRSHYPTDVMAISDTGAYCGDNLTHWVSCHPELLEGVCGFRKVRKRNLDFFTHTTDSHAEDVLTDYTWMIPKLCGTSSMLACVVGLHLGYRKIVLAGVPLDTSGHFYRADIPTRYNRSGIMTCWGTWARRFNGRVRSMSGESKVLLREPTTKWFNANEVETE